jgi:GAF domain-containing protein
VTRNTLPRKHTDGRALDDEDELSASLSGLTGLLSSHRALEDTLVRIAEFAVQAIPGAQGAGLTLLEEDRPQTVVATADFVRAVDDVQYSLQEGPCVSAVTEKRTFTSGNLGGEPQWPRFGPRIGRLGVHSALSLPLLLPDRVVGALNVYAHERDVFDEGAVRMGETFAPQAAVTVFNAQMLAQAERLVAQLQQALTSRATIDHAIGVLMSRSGGTENQAFDALRGMSQSRSMKLADVAAEIVNEARNRARARHVEPADPPPEASAV